MNRLICPLVTPYCNGSFDIKSMSNLIAATEPYVDVFVPCLSSGEGDKLHGADWEEVVSCVAENTGTPVFAGILNKTTESMGYIAKAAEIGCAGVVLPLGEYSEYEVKELLTVVSEFGLKVIFYNTEENTITDSEYIVSVCSDDSVFGFKDSSCDKDFLSSLGNEKPAEAAWEIYQGMETEVSVNDTVDGYFISLANIEPKFCRQLVSDRQNVDWSRLNDMVKKYNLEDPQWYIWLKQYLHTKSIITSSEFLGKKHR